MYWLLLPLLWVLFAQSCMQFRMSDTEARERFAKARVDLRIKRQSVNGYELHYTATGADSLPTLFFLHGSPGSWDAFERYMRDSLLLQRFRMIAIDRPGFGYSQFRQALPMERQSELIQGVIVREENGQPVYLVGHSLGGPLVVQMALDRPGYFDGLVILAGSIDPALEKPERWRPLLMNTPLKFVVPGAMRPSNVELWYLKQDLRSMKPQLGTLTERIWMIHGDRDRLVPYDNMAFGVKAFSATQRLDTLTISGADHFIPWSHYTIIRDVLLKL